MQQQQADGATAKGGLTVVIKSADGAQRIVELGENTLCQAYLNAVAAWSTGANNTGYNPTSPPMQFILGTGTGTPEVSDTVLFAPQSGTQMGLAARTANANTCIFTVNYNTGQLSGTFTEAGLLDANSNLMTHLVFQTPLSVTNTEAATFIWSVTWNAG